MPIVIVANATPTGSFTDGYATAATEAVSASSINLRGATHHCLCLPMPAYARTNGKICNPGSVRFPHMIGYVCSHVCERLFLRSMRMIVV